MNRRSVFTIVRKDLKVVRQNKGVLLPLILVPLILFIAVPAAVGLLPGAFSSSLAVSNDYDELLAMVAPPLRAELASYDPVQAGTVFFLVYMMAPLFLIVPMMVANVIAADSFVGERERKTLEALLYTPATDGELMLGKVLSAWLPAVAVAGLGFVVYGLVVNLASWPVIGHVFFPTAMWVVLVVWVAPAAAGLGLGAMILVSVRAKTFQEAYQTGSLVVLPVVILLIAQVSGLMYFSIGLVLLLGVVLWAVDAVLLWYGIKSFHRSELIARL